MILIETDFILALSSSRDVHHEEAVELLEGLRGSLALSPFTLVEVDLLVHSGGLKVRSLSEFHGALEGLLGMYGVGVVAPRPRHHALAEKLRGRLAELTYFDSLHASVALIEEAELLSYDAVYSKIPGLRWLHPRRALEKLGELEKKP